MTTETSPSVATSRHGDVTQYREFNGLAAVALGVAVLSVLTLLLYEIFNPIAFAFLPALAVGLGIRAWWTIRSYPLEYTGSSIAFSAIVVALLAMLSGWSLMAYEYATEVPEGFLRIQYSDLKIDPETGELPESLLALDGQRVFIKGYMYPGTKTHGIEQFVLCRDNGDCCFGGQPPLTDMIQVTLQDTQRINYNIWQQKVWGTFRIAQGRALHDDLGTVLYHLDDASFAP
jgi:hypothetical protein